MAAKRTAGSPTKAVPKRKPRDKTQPKKPFATPKAGKTIDKRPSPPPPVVLGGLATIGRPTTYQDTMPETVKRLRMLGLTNEELCIFFGVTMTAIKGWAKKFPAFDLAYAEGGEIADAEVAASLRERALGYSHKAVKMFVIDGEVHREEYIEHYPPDTNAAALWLSNRQRGRWKLKQDDDKASND